MPDAGKIITPRKNEVLDDSSFLFSDRARQRSREAEKAGTGGTRTRAAANERNGAFNPSLLPENQWTILMVNWSAAQW